MTDTDEISLLKDRVRELEEALKYYSNGLNFILNKSTFEIFELAEVVGRVVWDHRHPGKQAEPKTFGSKARAALKKEG